MCSVNLFTRLQKYLILDFKTLNDYYEAVKNQVRIMTLVNMKLCHLLPLLLWIVMVCSKTEGKETYNVYIHKGSLKNL